MHRFMAPPSLPPGWAPSLPRESCNYHSGRSAVASYVGTPMCLDCLGRLRPDLAASLTAGGPLTDPGR
jgi:hypothetical protein